jgi:hypothetical protein
VVGDAQLVNGERFFEAFLQNTRRAGVQDPSAGGAVSPRCAWPQRSRTTAVASRQIANPLGYAVATPRPISPAEGTTTPSAEATQRQNTYLGSVPPK